MSQMNQSTDYKCHQCGYKNRDTDACYEKCRTDKPSHSCLEPRPSSINEHFSRSLYNSCSPFPDEETAAYQQHSFSSKQRESNSEHTSSSEVQLMKGISSDQSTISTQDNCKKPYPFPSGNTSIDFPRVHPTSYPSIESKS